LSEDSAPETGPGGFAANSSVAFGGQLVVLLVGFSTGVIIARWLGADGKGAYALISSAAAMVSNVALLGLPFATTFFVGRHQWPPVRTALMGSVVSLVALVVVVGVLLIAGLERFYPAAARPEIRQALLLALGAMLPLQLVGTVASGVLRGRELIAQTVAPSMLADLARILLLVLFIVLLRVGILGAILSDSAGAGLALVALLFVLWRSLATWPRTSVRPSLGRLLSYGVRCQLGVLSFVLLSRIDLFLVSYFRDQAAAGVYSVAMTVAEFSTYPTFAIAMVLFPRLALLGEADRRATMLTVHRVVVGITAVWSVLLAAGALLLPVVYGRPFTAAIVPAWICLAGCFLFSETRVLHYFLTAEDRPLLPAVANLGGCAVMVGLDLWLVPRYGIVGAAVGYGAAVVADYAISVWMLRRFWGVPGWRSLLPGRQDATLARDSLLRLCGRRPG
jgi:O-antigen/teichoic acid export membrane protein